MEIKIIIATHKSYHMPEDGMYIPVHVGAEGKLDNEGKELNLGYVKDNTGDNISYKNNVFCELTGLYWAWKNLQADYIGLAHYRRNFKGKSRGKERVNKVLKQKELVKLIPEFKIFVPKKRKYYIETLYSHYAHTFDSKHLDESRDVIEKLYPEYLASFDKVMKNRSGYMFNMFIMQTDLLDEYCSWLFAVLFELEQRIDQTGMTDFEKRYAGRVSEILFNVWLNYKIEKTDISKKNIKQLPVIYMEKVNIFKKGIAFLKAKFSHKKYEKSF